MFIQVKLQHRNRRNKITKENVPTRHPQKKADGWSWLIRVESLVSKGKGTADVMMQAAYINKHIVNLTFSVLWKGSYKQFFSQI